MIAVSGRVVSRGDRVNPRLPTGEIEVEATEIDILSLSDPLPFQVNDEFDAGEEQRLRYRFLDLKGRGIN